VDILEDSSRCGYISVLSIAQAVLDGTQCCN